MNWIEAATDPPGHGYYIAAWDDNGSTRVSELWFNPDSKGSGWWPSRGYMARFIGDAAAVNPVRSLTVYAWMKMPEYPGPGPTIAYKWGERVIPPEDIIVVHEGVTERG